MEAALWRNFRHLRRVRKSLAPGQKLIAIVLIEHMGDILACEPVARHVREMFPDDHVLWIVGEHYRKLVETHPALDGCLAVSCLTECLRLMEHPGIDRVINLHVNLRRCTAFGTILHKQQGDTAITTENYFHYGSLLEAFCRSAGLPPLLDAPRFYLPPSLHNRTLPVPQDRPFIVLHATSNEAAKDWPVEKWRSLIAMMPASFPFQLVEVGLAAKIAPGHPSVLDLCGKLSLLELAEIIRRSSGFIGVDSGPAHFANAFERPSVVLLGRYRIFDAYMPYTGYLRVHADPMVLKWPGSPAEIPVEEVRRRIGMVMQN